MTDSPKPREVRGIEVWCTGPEEAPHPTRCLAIPSDGEVTCPDCGCAYRRVSGWQRLFGASWPKPE